MDWLTITGLGACGGAVVQAVTLSNDVHAWQSARRDALARGKSLLPKLAESIDPRSEALVALTRLVMGALAGFVFHSQVTGTYAAIAVGAAAPALLKQFGAARSLAALNVPEGTMSGTAASQGIADTDALLPEDG